MAKPFRSAETGETMATPSPEPAKNESAEGDEFLH